MALQRIQQDADPITRNRLITGEYRRLSEELAARIGRTNANWLTFGSWASMSAGRFIRGEVVPVTWGSDAVARGNLAIIADIGPRFVRFLEVVDSLPPLQWREAVSSEALLTESGPLAEAFGCYTAAALAHSAQAATGRAAGSRELAQLVLRANILIAHHEQDFADPLVDAAIPLGGIAGVLATRFVTVATPDGDLDVCRDVPRPGYLRGRQWPEDLDLITDQRLLQMLADYGQDTQSTRHSDARPGSRGGSGWATSPASSAPTSRTRPCSTSRRRRSQPARSPLGRRWLGGPLWACWREIERPIVAAGCGGAPRPRCCAAAGMARDRRISSASQRRHRLC